MLIEQETIETFNMTGQSHDCGDKLGYMSAFVAYGFRVKKLGNVFTNRIQHLLRI